MPPEETAGRVIDLFQPVPVFLSVGISFGVNYTGFIPGRTFLK
jgi:hypothetical protein